jgi:polyisoprenyl-phosphate glycosyltransferase
LRKPARSIGVTVPCFVQNEALAQCHERLMQVLELLDTGYEIVYVDDGSLDSSFLVLQAIHSSDPNVTIVELSRNFGHQIAVTAGLEIATGEVVLIMNAGLDWLSAVRSQLDLEIDSSVVGV